MTTLTKAVVGAVAAGAMVGAAASPALAQGREHRDHDGISAGDVIAGALVIGGIAAIAAAASNDGRAYRDTEDYRYDRAGYDRANWGWNDGNGDRYANGNPRQAIEQCVYSAERIAARSRYGGADVTDIRQVRSTRYGYEVRGRIAVNTGGRDWRRGDGADGRGWGGDYRGWNSNLRGSDNGWFTCRVEQGRVVNVDYGGVRGL